MADTANLDGERFRWLYDRVSAARRKSIDGYRFWKDKRLSLGAGVLLRVALDAYLSNGFSENATDLPEETITLEQIDLCLLEDDIFQRTPVPVIRNGQYGKPYLKDYPEFHFNVSHSGTKVLFACSDREVGCDIEERPREVEGIVKRCFTTEEQKAYFGAGERRSDVFIAIWTRKESYLKAIGVGLHEELSRVSVMDEDGNGKLSAEGLSTEGRIIKTAYTDDGYCYSICYRKKDGADDASSNK